MLNRFADARRRCARFVRDGDDRVQVVEAVRRKHPAIFAKRRLPLNLCQLRLGQAYSLAEIVHCTLYGQYLRLYLLLNQRREVRRDRADFLLNPIIPVIRPAFKPS